MSKINRRKFLGSSFVAAAGMSLPRGLEAKTASSTLNGDYSAVGRKSGPDIIDTNVNLFEWSFRHLKYGRTDELVSKLRTHRITQAWAGSYESLFHKDIDGVNLRLVEECKRHGDEMLLPFGTVNPAWPDWEEDLRRCHEVYKMPGIRLFPIYQTFDFAQPEFSELVSKAAERGLIIQIVGDVADIRHHHPLVEVRNISFEPLLHVLKQNPQAKVQLLYWNHRVRNKLLEKFLSETNVVLDISRIEGAGELGRLIEGNSWFGNAQIPSERLLFGSHAPYFPVETNIIKLFESPLSLDQMQAIMTNNANRVMHHV